MAGDTERSGEGVLSHFVRAIINSAENVFNGRYYYHHRLIAQLMNAAMNLARNFCAELPEPDYFHGKAGNNKLFPAAN